MQSPEEYMREAIRLSKESVEEGGGPFGAIIVDTSGEIIGRGKNRVTLWHDPTAHGEIVAIRDTKRENLGGCTLYTSSEPCPGCFFEIVFNAGINTIYYGDSVTDAAHAGFADDRNWELLKTSVRELGERMGTTITQLLPEEAKEAFNLWVAKTDKVEYYRA